MQVSDIMSRTVHTVGPDALLRQVVTLICLHHISGLPVVDEESRVVGIISERDILKALYPGYDELINDPARSRDFEDMESRYSTTLWQKVKEVMVRNVVTVTPETPILKAASIMLLKRIRRLPVVESGRLVGIVSLGDVHQAIFIQHLAAAAANPADFGVRAR